MSFVGMMRARTENASERARSASAAVLMSCLFFGLGASVPFLPRWLEVDRGLNGVQIAMVLSGAQLLRLVIGPLLGEWTDRFPDRRTPLRALSLVALIAYCGFALSTFFPAMAVLAFLGASASSAMIPMAEGGALRAAKNGGWPFGLARSIGSACFILGSVAVGYHISAQGPGVAIWWQVGGIALAAVFLWFLTPSDPAPTRHAQRGDWRETLRALLRSRRLLLALAAGGLIQSAHAFYYGFSTLVWRGQGLEASTIGLLWACGTLAEICFFLIMSRGERRLAPEWLVFAGGAGAVLRWTCMSFAPPLLALWPLQTLHALTFAACHVGAMRIVYEEIPEEQAGLAGALYGAVSGGTLIGLAILASGWLYDHFGVGGYFAMVGLAAAGLSFGAALVARSHGKAAPMASR